MTEDEIKAEMNVYNKIIADNYALYCETPKDNGRTDTLIKAIEELERTKKQLAIAVEALEAYKEDRWNYEDEYDNYPIGSGGGWCWAEQALQQIKELEK